MVRLNEAAIAGLAFFASLADALPGLERRQSSSPGTNVLTAATPAPTANVVQQAECWVFGGSSWGECESSSAQAQTIAAATKSTVTVRTGVLTTTISAAASRASSTSVAPSPSTSAEASVVSQAHAANTQPAIPALSSAIAHSNLPAASSLAVMIHSMAPSIPAASGNPQIQSVAGALTSAIRATNLQQASSLVQVLNSMAPVSPSAPTSPTSSPSSSALPGQATSSHASSALTSLHSSASSHLSTALVSQNVPINAASSIVGLPPSAIPAALQSLGLPSSVEHSLGGLATSGAAQGQSTHSSTHSVSHSATESGSQSSSTRAVPTSLAPTASSTSHVLTSHVSSSTSAQRPTSASGQSTHSASTHDTTALTLPASVLPSGAIPALSNQGVSSATLPGGSPGVIIPTSVAGALSSAGLLSSIPVSSSRGAFSVPLSELPSQVAESLASHHSTVLDGTVPAVIMPGTVAASSKQSTVAASTTSTSSQARTTSASSAISAVSSGSSSQSQTPSASSPSSSQIQASSTSSAISAAFTSPGSSGTSSQAQSSSTRFAVSTTSSSASQVHASSTTAAPSSSSSVSGAAQSCTANGVTYHDGQQIDGYTIHCSQDNSQPGSVTFPVQSGGFSKCPAACDAQPGCVGWTYSGNDSGNCYLKTSEGPYSTAPSYIVSGFKNTSSASGSASSSVTSSFDLSSASTQDVSSSVFTQSSLSTMSVQSEPSTASASSAIQSVSSSSASSTSDQSATTITLPGDSLFTVPVGAASTSASSAPGSTVSLSSASILSSAPASSTSTSATGTLVTVTLGTSPSQPGSSSTSSAPASPTSASCDQLGNGIQFNGYTVACDTDAPGSDIGAVSAPSFADCFGKCTAFVGCSSFSFVGGNGAGTCYLKNRYAPSTSNPNNVDSGFIFESSQISKASSAVSSSASISGSAEAQQTIITLPNSLIVTGQVVTPSAIPTGQTSFFAGSPYYVTLANGQVVTGQVATGAIVAPSATSARISTSARIGSSTQSSSSVVSQETLIRLPNGQIVTHPTAPTWPSPSVVAEQGNVITLPNGQIITLPESSAPATTSFTDVIPTAITLPNGQVVTFPTRSSTASSSAAANVVTLTMSTSNVMTASSDQASSISSAAELTTVTLSASSGSGSSAATVSALSPAATSGASCSASGATYQSGQQVDGYTLHCSQDNSQPGFTVVPVQSGGFSQCPSACDAQAGCTGWTYSGDDSGDCYLKTAEGTYLAAPTYIVSGFKTSATQGFVSPSQSLSRDPETSVVPSSSPTTVNLSTASNAQASSSVKFTTVTLLAASNTGVSSSATFLTVTRTNGNAGTIVSSGPIATSSSGLTTDCEALAGNQVSAEYVDSLGYIYNITCKHDFPGGDIDAVSSPDFTSCFSKCDSNARCVGFSWLQDGGPGTCYLKGSQGKTISTSVADVAVKVGFVGVQSTYTNALSATSFNTLGQSVAALTVTLSTVSQAGATSVPSPLVSVAPTTAAASCEQLGSGSQIGQYTTRCGTDALGGDFMVAQASSFAECIPLCDAQPQCIGYAYVGGSGPGTCYFKSTHEPDSTNSNVDIAFKPAAGNVLPASVLTSVAGSPNTANTPTIPTATHTFTSVIPSGVIPGATGEVPITVLPSDATVPSGNVPFVTASGFVVAAPTTALPSTFLRTSAVPSTSLATTQLMTSVAPSSTREIPSDETSWFSTANTAGNLLHSTSTAVRGLPGSSSIIGTSTVHASATSNVAIDTFHSFIGTTTVHASTTPNAAADTVHSVFTASNGAPRSSTIIGTTTITALTTPSAAVHFLTLSAVPSHAQSLPASGVIPNVGTVPISLISSGHLIPSDHTPIGTWHSGAVVVAPTSALIMTASIAAHTSAALITSASARNTPSRASNSVVSPASLTTVTLGQVSSVPGSSSTVHHLSAALSSVAADMSTVAHGSGPAVSSTKLALTSSAAAASTHSVPGHDINLGPALPSASQHLNSLASAKSTSAPQTTLKSSFVVSQPTATTSYFQTSVVSGHQVTVTGGPIVSIVANGEPGSTTPASAAAPAPSGPPMIIDPVQPVTNAGATQCDQFRQSKDDFHYLKATVLYGNRALDGAFLAAPTVPGHEVARLTHNQTTAAEAIYEPTTRSYFVRGDDSIVNREDTCQYHGLALISHPTTEPGPLGLVPGSATTGATESADGVCSFAGLPAPYSFSTWYACDGEMTLKYLPHGWHKGGVQKVDYNKCAAVILHQFDLYH